MTIAFTICSINYLAQARTLGQSLSLTNPDIRFFIGLVDKLDGVELEAEYETEFPMIEIDKIGISDFKEMCDRYNITELNTAVKPFYFTYFFNQYPEAKNLTYFDPDIIIFQKLDELLSNLEKYPAVLTPHIGSPIDDRLTPNELHHLNTGIYNLGFVAFRRKPETLEYIKWWEHKLRYECLIDLCDGLFVDQNWMNFLPVFVPDTYIENHPGYNMAYWNIHERTLESKNNKYLVNEKYPLIFFHYSGYDPGKQDVLSKYQDRFELKNRPDLHSVFKYYKDQLLNNGNAYYRHFKCAYIKPEKVYRYQRIRKLFKTPFEYLAAKSDTF